MFRKWRQVLTPLNIISTLPLLFAMLCGGYLSYRYNILLRENRDLVVHTYQVINAIDGLLIRLEDAETGQRGYIITGDASYLAPYERTYVDEIAPELTGHGLPLSKCEAYNRVYDQPYGSH